MAELYGYAGRVLRVDLTTRTITEIPSEKYLPQYLGGRGLGAKIYWDEIKPSVKALDPENRLIFATGPFQGTGVAGGGFTSATTKSPWLIPANSYFNSHAGMGFGNEMKYAGYDAIIIQGRAETLSYLWINDGHIEIMDGLALQSLDTYSTREMLWGWHGRKAKIACIGPAGENLVVMSPILVDSGSAFGDGGFGAVMGSKNLKAIVIRGTGRIKVANPQKLLELNKTKIYQSSIKAGEKRVIDGKTVVGQKPPIGDIWHQQVENTMIGDDVKAGIARIKVRACPGCPKPCRPSVTYLDHSVPTGVAQCAARLAPLLVEQEFGGLPKLWGKGAWNHSTQLDKYGLCAFGLCSNLEWIPNAYKEGILNDNNTGLPFAKLGTQEFLGKLLRMMAFREGFGDVLARHESEIVKYIMEHEEFGPNRTKIKDLVAFANYPYGNYTAARGVNIRFPIHAPTTTRADGIRIIVTMTDAKYGSEPEPYWMRLPQEMQGDVAKKWLGSEKCVEMFYWGPEIAEGAIRHEHIGMETDSLVVCATTVVPMGTMTYPPYLTHPSPTTPANVKPYSKEDLLNTTPNWGAEYWSAIFGENIMQEEIWKKCEMLRNLERAIYVRDGYTREDEQYPDSFYRQKYQDKLTCPKDKFEDTLEQYYQFRGWDVATGWPKRAKLEELGLKDVADELQALGKLPVLF